MPASKIVLVDSNEVEAYRGPMGRRTKVLIDGTVGSSRLSLGLVYFPPGSSSDFHTRREEEIFHVLEGVGILATEQGEYVTKPGVTVFIPPGVKHKHENRGDGTLVQLWIFSPQGPEHEIRKRPVDA